MGIYLRMEMIVGVAAILYRLTAGED